MTLVNKVKGTFKNTNKDYLRLIILSMMNLVNYSHFKVVNLVKNKKYITIKLDESKSKVYGLERVNFLQHIKVVEGL